MRITQVASLLLALSIGCGTPLGVKDTGTNEFVEGSQPGDCSDEVDNDDDASDDLIVVDPDDGGTSMRSPHGTTKGRVSLEPRVGFVCVTAQLMRFHCRIPQHYLVLLSLSGCVVFAASACL